MFNLSAKKTTKESKIRGLKIMSSQKPLVPEFSPAKQCSSKQPTICKQPTSLSLTSPFMKQRSSQMFNFLQSNEDFYEVNTEHNTQISDFSQLQTKEFDMFDGLKVDLGQPFDFGHFVSQTENPNQNQFKLDIIAETTEKQQSLQDSFFNLTITKDNFMKDFKTNLKTETQQQQQQQQDTTSQSAACKPSTPSDTVTEHSQLLTTDQTRKQGDQDESKSRSHSFSESHGEEVKQDCKPFTLDLLQAENAPQDIDRIDEVSPSEEKDEDMEAQDKPAIATIVPVMSSPSSNLDNDADESSDDGAVGFKCKHCGMRFSGPVNLGGHISKKHPRMSEAYNKKMETRKANEELRAMRKVAQAKITEITTVSHKLSPRVFVTQLTKLYLSKQTETDKKLKQGIDEKIRELCLRIARAYVTSTGRVA